MNDQAKTKNKKCPYCTPTDPESQCVLATIRTVIDGKEYTACCSNQNNSKQKKAKNPKKESKK
jgi:hypothetical protein